MYFEHSGDNKEFDTPSFLATLMSPVRMKHMSVDMLRKTNMVLSQKGRMKTFLREGLIRGNIFQHY